MFPFAAEKPACYTADKENEQVNPLKIVCLDMEGVIALEIWIELAERTGVENLGAPRGTNRLRANAYRLDILNKHGLGIEALQPIIDGIEPHAGSAGVSG